MGFQAQKFGFLQGWYTHSATAIYPLPTGKLGGFFRNPELYLQLSQGDSESRGQMSWKSSKKLAMLLDDQSWVADRLLVGAPPKEIMVGKGPDSADVLPPTFGPSYDLSSLDDVAPKEAHITGLQYAKMMGLFGTPKEVAAVFRPSDDFVSDAGMASGLAYTVAELKATAVPQKLLAQRILSQRSQQRMENIPLQPLAEDTASIRKVIGTALTDEALYFLVSNSHKPGEITSSYKYEKLAETMWFSMLWSGFSKYSEQQKADIAVVMENLEAELHDRMLGAISDLSSPQLDKKLIAAATLAVIHPEAFTVDLKLLDKAVRSLAALTVHQNIDVSHNASHMLARLVKLAGDVYPEVVSSALAAMINDKNIQVSYTAAELIARVVESNGLKHSSIVDPAAQAMRGVMLSLGDRSLGGASESASRYFSERFLRVDTVSLMVVEQRAQAVKEKLARVQALVQERLSAHP